MFQYAALIQNLKLFLVIGMITFLTGCSNNIIKDETQPRPITKIALLLPLESSSNQTNRLTKHLINAARLAADDLKHLNLTLSVYPTSGEPTRALHAAKAAVEGGAQILVGPLFSQETAAIRASKEIKNIQIISLSNDPNVADKNIFILGTTIQTSADRLVKFAMSKGLHRIAIIGPKGTIGFNGITSAEEAIKKNGAFLTTTALYPLDFREIQKSASTIYKKLINSNSTAIIFTDTPTRGLGFISEQVSQFYDKDNKKKPQFIGLTRWDSSQQILNESSLNKGWFIIPDTRFKKTFQERYIDTFGSKPNEISSLAYDAIALIGAVIKETQSNRSSVKFKRKHFMDPNGFVGVNGIFRFKPDNSAERSLSVAQVKSGNFIVIDHAKSKF